MFDISNTGRRVVMILPKNMTVSRISQVGIPMSVFNEVFGLNLDKSERSERISI